MTLHTKIRQTNIGMIKSQPAWALDFRLDVTAEENELIQTYRLGERTVGTYLMTDGKNEGYISVKQAVAAKGGQISHHLGGACAFKASLVEGCRNLRDYLRLIQEVRAGAAQEFDFPLHEQSVGPVPPLSADVPPTVAPIPQSPDQVGSQDARPA